ncbi:HNH endonuclease signature motif containing protein [Cohnella cholangitidis]|uniref:HNH endonuclease n=1 Tax=Cohnella cholangitidis TaxID=2598458 RepID=A0A7G5C5G3_9BACL|nr:HNH endonuclease signature motif containing protein [Cohnella cholangitidis]QMV44447.1 HNH endonuclease [Cohnella cholangitidis]
MAGLASDVKSFIHEHYRGTPFLELVRLVQGRFGESSTYNQIRAYVHNHKLWNGLDGRIKPGNVPFNKGKKAPGTGHKPTQFKKGNRPANYMPVGSERINTDGYVDVKIADPNKWVQVHLLIWEAVNGPIPVGHVVIFADANKLNTHPDNLVLVSRGQLARLNQNHLIKGDAELTKSGIVVADLISKIAERSKKK